MNNDNLFNDTQVKSIGYGMIGTSIADAILGLVAIFRKPNKRKK